MTGKNKKAPSAKRVGKSTSQRAPQKLDDVSDAPESGEPREQGRSRGRVIDRAATRSASPGPATTPAQRSASRKTTAGTRAKDPRAAAERDESGNTRNEAWESGRQKAMDD
jgi:hypothetical protein